MPVPSRTIPPPRPKEKAVKIRKEPTQVMAKNEKYRVQTNGHQSSGDLPLTIRPPKTHGVVNSVKSSPAPLDHGPKHPESNLSDNARTSSKSSSSESHGVTKSRSPARDALPPPKTNCEAAVLSAPTACSSLLPERPTKEVLGEDPPRSARDSLVSGKPTHSPQLSDIRSSSASPVSASGSLRKSKMRRPLSLPRPPLLWDGGEIPVSSKPTCLAIDRNPDTLNIPTGQWNKVVEDKTKVMADCSATQYAPSFTRPGVVADTLPVAAHSGLVPAASAKSADLSARPLTKSAPTPLTQNINHFPFFVRAHSLPPPDANHIWGIPANENGGRLHSAITSTSPISDVSAPAMTSTVSFQPPCCDNESPIPMCVDSPPPALALPTPLPVPSARVPLALPTNSVAVPSTSANASANPTGQPTSDDDVTDMDTTPPQPSKVLVVTASPSPGRRCRKPQVYSRIVSSTSPPAAKYPRLASDYTGGPQTTARDRKTSLVPAAVTSNSPVVNSAATHAPVNSTSAKPVDDSEPMDTTPAP
ncbi:hypothetical protein mRhiFer1_008365 [Rhinolophus ferrumequinum]|uniref:Uncharacterized protein n=1 Tax=Rhinolophus ferrumequinum TaxID=59479 RepID=A0A7J7VDX1_RHIFE|nr:hypothetical protein mRhiFer1_008365 [Rhinolophus ferrumequinum]